MHAVESVERESRFDWRLRVHNGLFTIDIGGANAPARASGGAVIG